MATKCISYTIELYANFEIEADSDEEALKLAWELLYNDEFRETHIVPALDDPFQWGDAIADAKAEVLHDFDCEGVEPEYTRKDIDEILGR